MVALWNASADCRNTSRSSERLALRTAAAKTLMLVLPDFSTSRLCSIIGYSALAVFILIVYHFLSDKDFSFLMVSGAGVLHNLSTLCPVLIAPASSLSRSAFRLSCRL